MNTKFKCYLRTCVPYIGLLIISFIIIWPQIHNHAFISGLDYYFHMSRTYETAMQIKTGHFSYFLSLFSWNHNARIVSALYGPMGGYISGLILLLTHSWLRWEICVEVITLFLAGSTMYYLGYYWHLNKAVNFLISILYMMSAPISDFIFMQVFTGFGAALIPLVALLASKVLIKKDVSPIELALILFLIIEIHLMTFVLSILFLIPCLLISLIVAKGHRSRLFLRICEGFGVMLTLSFNVWGSILEVFISNYHHILPTYPGTHLGDKPYSSIINTYPKSPLSQTPSLIGIGILFAILVTIILWLINLRRSTFRLNTIMVLGLFFIWISSGWFPWQLVLKYATFVATLIQFPNRFLPIGLVAIYLVMGKLLSHYCLSGKVQKDTILLLLLTLSIWGYHHSYDNHYVGYKGDHYSFSYNIKAFKGSQVINWNQNVHWQSIPNSQRLRNSLRNNHPEQFLTMVYNPVPDYLPTNVKYLHPNQYRRINPYDKYRSTYYHKIKYRWKILTHARELITIPSKKNQLKMVPFVKYAHTQVMVNHHVMNPRINQVGAMGIPLKRGSNRLVLQYHPSFWFKMGMLISIIAWSLLIIYLVIKIR